MIAGIDYFYTDRIGVRRRLWIVVAAFVVAPTADNPFGVGVLSRCAWPASP